MLARAPAIPGRGERERSTMAEHHIQVSDDEIQRIIDENEAGIADLMAVYEPAEASYMAALTVGPPGGVSPASTESIPSP